MDDVVFRRSNEPTNKKDENSEPSSPPGGIPGSPGERAPTPLQKRRNPRIPPLQHVERSTLRGPRPTEWLRSPPLCGIETDRFRSMDRAASLYLPRLSIRAAFYETARQSSRRFLGGEKHVAPITPLSKED